MLDAADVLIDRHPVIDRGTVEAGLCDGRTETRKIPGRFEKRVEGIGLASCRLAAGRTSDILPCRVIVERVARDIEVDVFRQSHRQVRLGHRNDPAGSAMDHRNWTAPIALPGNPPVAESIIDRPFTPFRGFQAIGDLGLRGLDREAVEELGIDHHAVAGVGIVADRHRGGVLVGRGHHRDDVEAIPAREIEIALIVTGTSENGAGAVIHEHEIGNVDRQFDTGPERVRRREAGVEAFLFRRLDGRLAGPHAVAFGQEVGQFRVRFRRVRRPAGDWPRWHRTWRQIWCRGGSYRP